MEAGISLTLRKLTVKALAERLGVSIVAIYNNIDTLELLATAVAEEILHRWEFPMPSDHETFEEALMRMSFELRTLVHDNPGIAEYVIDLGAASPRAVQRLDLVLQRYSTLFLLIPMQARWAVATVAEHAIALAELVHVANKEPRDDLPFLARTDLTLIPLTVDTETRDAVTNFEWSMRAVVMGTAIVVDHPRFGLY